MLQLYECEEVYLTVSQRTFKNSNSLLIETMNLKNPLLNQKIQKRKELEKNYADWI